MQNILYTYGGEARVESHKIFPLVSSDVEAWLYTVTKDHMKKHHKEYFLAEIGPEAFKRNHGLEKSWLSGSRQYQSEGIDIGGRHGEEHEPEFAQFLLQK